MSRDPKPRTPPAWVWGVAFSVLVHGVLAAWALRSPARLVDKDRESVPIRLVITTPPKPEPAPSPQRVPPKEAEPARPERKPTKTALAARTPVESRRRSRPFSPPPAAPTQGPSKPAVPSKPDGAGPAVGQAPAKATAPSSGAGSVRDLSRLDLRAKPRVKPVDPLLPPTSDDDKKKDVVERLALKPTAGGGYLYVDPTFYGRIQHDGRVVIKDRNQALSGTHKPVNGVATAGVGIPIDMTDVIMRAAGDDPYLHRKMTFLKETSELRAAMAAAACEERLTKAIYSLKTDLERIWADPSVSAQVRREQLFQLWDDCAERGDDEAEIVGYADQARATIIAFIQDRLPAGSALAYSPVELRALNRRRRSSSAFDPYGPSGAFGE